MRVFLHFRSWASPRRALRMTARLECGCCLCGWALCVLCARVPAEGCEQGYWRELEGEERGGRVESLEALPWSEEQHTRPTSGFRSPSFFRVRSVRLCVPAGCWSWFGRGFGQRDGESQLSKYFLRRYLCVRVLPLCWYLCSPPAENECLEGESHKAWVCVLYSAEKK